MLLKTDLLKADGFNEQEIRQIEAHYYATLEGGRFDNQASLIKLNGEIKWVCRTIAEILEKLRPGCWLSRSDQLSERN